MTLRWKKEEFAAKKGLALKGFDTVSYFTKGRPKKGKKEFELSWRGVRWRFANEEHMNLFTASPEHYAPQCGGYCTFAVSFSENPKAPRSPAGSPRLWHMIDGKLYLNNNPFAYVLFRILKRADKSNEVWEKLSG